MGWTPQRGDPAGSSGDGGDVLDAGDVQDGAAIHAARDAFGVNLNADFDELPGDERSVMVGDV